MINYLHQNDIDNMTINEIKKRIEYLSNENNKLREQIDNFNSQEELTKAIKELEKYRKNSFSFSETDQKGIDAFVNKHYCMNKSNKKGDIHIISYVFTPTSVTDCAEVVCSCGEKLQFFY